MKEKIMYKTFGFLKPGYTYLIKEVQHDSWIEIEVMEKSKNAICVRLNPKTGNAIKWYSKEDKIWEILDSWKTKKVSSGVFSIEDIRQFPDFKISTSHLLGLTPEELEANQKLLKS